MPIVNKYNSTQPDKGKQEAAYQWSHDSRIVLYLGNARKDKCHEL